KKMKHKKSVELLAGFFLLVNWNLCSTSGDFRLDPPADLRVTDPGHLGLLRISWASPSSLENVTNCSVHFEVQYFDTYEDRWTVIRTTLLEYSANFDLGKDVHVKVQTLLRGPCTENAELQSPPAEVLLPPADKGTGPSISSFNCVFYQKEYMDCRWGERGVELSQVQDHLFYWHSEMGQTMECPEYIQSNGVRRGCRFPEDVLEEFTDFNICVNGSSAAGPLRPSFFTLQIQNHVKPAAIEGLSLDHLPNGNVVVEWSPSRGKIPDHCLEFEVESTENNVLHRFITRETTYSSAVEQDWKERCFRVRSRIHQFCADRSFWSEWSHQHCLAGSPKTDDSTMKVVLACVLALSAVTLIASLIYVWTRTRRVKNRGAFCSGCTSRGLLGGYQGLPPSFKEKLVSHLKQAEVQPFSQDRAV
ncbi:interleukin-13 receptor subunit alpha-2-like isoform X1, partial [Arapaima gigas]